MVITSERHLDPDIWSETPYQGTGIEDMIFITWYKEVIKWMKINPKWHHLPGPSVKEVCYASYINSYLKNSYTHPVKNTWFYHRLPGPYNRKNLEPSWYPLSFTK